jgi:hypothetical protein
MPVDQAYRPEKLEELILYLAGRMEKDGHKGIGRIKLAKLIFFADFEAFARYGESITGATYTVDEYGPAPDQELTATLDLEAAGDFEWQKRWRKPQIPVAKREPRLDVIPPSELEIVDELLDRHRRHTGADLRDIAHELPAWKARTMGAKVPYWSVYMAKKPPTRDDVEWGEAVVRELGNSG